MQTFLPVSSFEESVKILDYRRLGKQRVETWQIWLALTRGGGWSNHPAVKMWKDSKPWLLFYGLQCCLEWISRGYRDTMLIRFIELLEEMEFGDPPSWLGDERLHSTHRANLIRKDPIYYGKFGWSELPINGYFWPKE